MPICSKHKVKIRQWLETALHDLPAKEFLFKSTSAANPTTFFLTYAWCKITLHTRADVQIDVVV